MRGYGVLEGMEVALLLGNAGELTVPFHEVIKRRPINRRRSVRGEENLRFAGAGTQIGLEEFYFVRPQGVLSRDATLRAVKLDAVAVEVNIRSAKHSHFRCSQSVTIGDQEKCTIPFTFDSGKQTFEFT